MADLNKVYVIGRLTHDPELRYTPSGKAVTDLRIATSRKHQTREGEVIEETLYITATVWGRQAENCCQYIGRASLIHLEGHLITETWESKTGEKHTRIKIESERVQFLDKRPERVLSDAER